MTQVKPYRITLLALSAGFLSVASAGPVTIADASAGRGNRAVAELQRHLELMTGEKPEIVTDGSGMFVVGAPAPGGKQAGPLEARYRAEGGRVYFWGDRTAKVMDGRRSVSEAYDGPLFAVYEFLDRELGFRWTMPGERGVVVPKGRRLVPPDGTEGVYVPHYDIGRMRSANVDDLVSFHLPVLSGPKVAIPDGLLYTKASARALATDVSLWYLRNRNYSRHVFRYGHAFTDWYARFHETHPEYLAQLEDGRRGNAQQPSRTMLCVSCPGVVDQIVADWQAEGCPKFLNVCENDGGGLCRCPGCRALDCDLPGEEFLSHKTDRYLNLWNRIAQKAVKIRHDVQLVGYIYSYYRHLPRRERIAYPDNMIFGTVPSLADDYRTFYGGWKKSGLKQFFLRPNFHSSTASLPRGAEKLIYDVFAYCRDNGMIGADFDVYPGRFSTSLESYVTVRLLQDPMRSFESIVDEYCAAYGEAAPDVKAYYARIRARREASDAATRAALGAANLLDDSQTSVRQMDCHTEAALEGDFDVLRQAHVRGVTDPVCRRRLETLLVQAHEYVLVYRFLAAGRGKDATALETVAKELLDYRLEHRDDLMDHYTMTMGSRVRGTETQTWLKVPFAVRK